MPLRAMRVRDYMAASLVVLHPEMEMLHAVHLLVQNRISGAPVTDDRGNLVGVLSELDCMRVALAAGYHEEFGGLVGEYMSTDVRTVQADDSIVDLAQRFLDAPYRRYPVLQDNRLVGQVSRRDVLRALQAMR